ncbi:MAG: hypothetical protein ABW352_05390 [Polyangiales bacterium]
MKASAALATVDTQQSALLDATMTGLLGLPSNQAVDLTVLDHQALANANVSMASLLTALNNAGIGTDANGALNVNVPMNTLLTAGSLVVNTNNANPAAAAALDKLRLQTASVNTQSIKLGDLITTDTRSGPLANQQINLLDLVNGSISTFNQKNVAAVRNVTLNGGDLGLANVSTLELSLVVVEPAVMACGPVGTQFYSAGIRLRIHLNLNALGVNLNLAPLTSLRLDLTQLDIVAAVSRASGTISAINAVASTLTVQATPGVAELYLGTISNADFIDRGTPIDPVNELTPAIVANLKLVLLGIDVTATVSAKGYALGTTPTAKPLNFTSPYPKTLTATTSSNFAGNLVSSLLSNLQVSISTFSGVIPLIANTLNALTGGLLTLVTNTLKGTGGLLDTLLSGVLTSVVDPLLNTLGVKLGEMSVTASAPYKVPTGSTCNDNLYCTENDTCNASGVCTGAARNCADALSCTVDSCDEVNRLCKNTLASGQCVINGLCVASGVADPSNGCMACAPEQSTTAYTPRAIGASCNDGLYCTAVDTCSVLGVCVGTPRLCNDNLPCTVDACDEGLGRCNNLVSLGCVVNGQCVLAGTDDPTNPCRSCNPLISTTSYTNKVANTPCTDGLFCTVGDACNGAGACVSAPRDCSDLLACTSDACDEAGKRCTSTLATGCMILGQCVASGTSNPLNPCLACNPAVSTLTWTPKAMGTSCDDGLFCTTGDSCNALGLCTGTTRVCDPGGTGCSSVCDELSRSCKQNILGCLIGGACVSQGTVNPLNGCQICNPLLSTTGFSAGNQGQACDDGLYCTTGDTCGPLGTCLGTPRDCSDMASCTTDTCDELNDRCGALVTNGCLINNQCVPANAADPTSPCRACQPLLSTTSYTARLPGTTCDDGKYCTVLDLCSVDGVCAGTPRTCGVGDACNTMCDESAGRCRSDIDGCSINGLCVPGGTSDPANPCRTCNPSLNRYGWSNKTSGSSCDDSLYCTTGDTCNALGLCVGAPRACGGSGSCVSVCNEDQDQCVAALTGCTIDGVCRSAGSVDPSNSCRTCNPAESTTAWSLAANGTSCSDGLYCTQNDTCNASGTCTGTARSCTDNVSCTADVCDELGDRCVSTVSNGCLIDNTCYPSGVTDPLNNCRTCNPSVSDSGWSNKMIAVACDDGRFCTENDACDGQGTCAGTLRSCSADGTCSSFCDESTSSCRTGISGCNILGTCLAAGSTDPSNPCRTCDPTRNPAAWSLKATGSTCDDGLFCTTGDACSAAGACAGMQQGCDDSVGCTTDACNESSRACTHTVAGGCNIDGACVMAGAPGPDGPCRICDPARSTTSWTPAQQGTSCDDGQFCSPLDRCDGNGSCVGSGVRCLPDGLGCTEETCNESTDSCTVRVTVGCAVGNQCFSEGASAPNDNCSVCTAAKSTISFSSNPFGARCDTDGDGLLDGFELNPDGTPVDHDGDELPDLRDPDDDEDGLPTRDESSDPNGDGDPEDARDLDEDGLPDYLDPDDDDDGRNTSQERDEADEYGDDVDNDGIFNWYDFDSDGDGVTDASENYGDGDSNADGIPDYVQANVQPNDDDMDGIPTDVECPAGKDNCDDSDGDGQPNWNDPDDDNDGVLTRYELRNGARIDTDRDDVFDHLDTDDDGDTFVTREEAADPNGDGNPSDARDTDGDGTPDYLDRDSPQGGNVLPDAGTPDAGRPPVDAGRPPQDANVQPPPSDAEVEPPTDSGPRRRSGLAGGGGCALQGEHALDHTALAMLALLWLRRRRQRSRPGKEQTQIERPQLR